MEQNITQSKQERNQNKQKSGSEQKIEREQIENTPIYVIGNEEQGYCLTISNYRITTTKETKEEAIKTLETNKWDIICNIIIILQEIREKELH